MANYEANQKQFKNHNFSQFSLNIYKLLNLNIISYTLKPDRLQRDVRTKRAGETTGNKQTKNKKKQINESYQLYLDLATNLTCDLCHVLNIDV